MNATTYEATGVVKQAYDNANLAGDAAPEELHEDNQIDLYIEATKIKKELESKVKELDRVLGAIQPVIIEHFTQLGQQRVTRRGMTVYLSREVWPKPVDSDLVEAGETPPDEIKSVARARLIEALKSDGSTAHLISEGYNAQQLRSFIMNDCDEGEDGLPVMPEHLEGIMGVSEVFRAKVTASSK